MRKPAIITLASLGLLGIAGSSAWACDWGEGYRQSRVYRYSYAPRTYGYSAPTYGYRAAYLDDDDYDDGYGYGGVAVGVNVGRDRRFHRRHFTRTSVNVGERSGRVREGTPRSSSGGRSAAFQGAGSGESGRAGGSARGMSGGMGGGSMGGGTVGRGADTGGRR
jgi:hypothetical protein